MIRKLFAELRECPLDEIKFAKDSCGTPAFCLPPVNIAIAYKNLICPSEAVLPALRLVCEKNVAAIKQYPFMLEGDGCLSTILSSSRDLIAQTGNHGLLAIGNAQGNCGILIKSYNGNWRNTA